MRIADSTELSNTHLMIYAKTLGYQLSADDCEEIRETKLTDETVRQAVEDYLNAYETCRDFSEERVKK